MAKRHFDPKAGFGGVVSVDFDGDAQFAENFMHSLSFAMEAPSLGGVESLVTRPANTSHCAMSEEARLAMGITPSTVRISVGIEDEEDLIQDVLNAIDLAAQQAAEENV
eukprot:gene29080-32290_t